MGIPMIRLKKTNHDEYKLEFYKPDVIEIFHYGLIFVLFILILLVIFKYPPSSLDCSMCPDCTSVLKTTGRLFT